MAKLFVSEAAGRCADRAVQIFGGRGYMRSNVAERFLRELRVDRIWEGTSEVQRRDHRPRARAPRGRGDDPLTRRRARTPTPGPRSPAAAAVDRGGRGHRSAGELRRADAAESRGDRLSAARSGASTRSAPRSSGGPACRPSRTCPTAGRRGRRRDPGGGGRERHRPGRRAWAAAARSCSAPGSPRSTEARELQRELVAAARRHGLPVCGPNCNGIVAMHRRVALWGDALVAARAGRVALVSQSGNVAVNALATRRGLRFHTVIASGNQAVSSAADYLDFLAREDGVSAIALYLEDDGGPRLCDALAACAERGVAGRRAEGRQLARRRARRRGPQRGARRRPADLQEPGRGSRSAYGQRTYTSCSNSQRRSPSRSSPPSRGRAAGLAIMTCSGGDSAQGADESARLELACHRSRRRHARAPAGAAAARRDGREPARLHGDDLGRRGGARRARAHRRRGSRDRPGARLLRPAARDRRRGGGVVARGARGDHRRRRAKPRSDDGLLDATGAARRRGGVAVRVCRCPRRRGPANRPAVRRCDAAAGGRPGAALSDRRHRPCRGSEPPRGGGVAGRARVKGAPPSRRRERGRGPTRSRTRTEPSSRSRRSAARSR